MHVRYVRMYQGLRVVGGDLIVHSSSTGSVVSVDYASGENVAVATTTPKVAAPDQTAALVVFASGHQPVLAWELHKTDTAADGDPVDRLTYVNANSGRTIASWDKISTADGTGNSLYSGSVPLKTVLSGSTYQLNDTTRGSSKIYDLNNGTGTGTGTLFTDADNVWGNGS
ncbi:MAG: peptidase M4 family protein, partial [Nocardioidaceae bacterium]